MPTIVLTALALLAGAAFGWAIVVCRLDPAVSPHAMSARYIIIAAAIILLAGALLYAADHKSLVPTAPHSNGLFQVR